jgi:hypothetical protein
MMTEEEKRQITEALLRRVAAGPYAIPIVRKSDGAHAGYVTGRLGERPQVNILPESLINPNVKSGFPCGYPDSPLGPQPIQSQQSLRYYLDMIQAKKDFGL